MTGKCEYDGQVGAGDTRGRKGNSGNGGAGQIQVDRGNTTRAPRTRVKRVLTSIRDTGERRLNFTAQFLLLLLSPKEKLKTR